MRPPWWPPCCSGRNCWAFETRSDQSKDWTHRQPMTIPFCTWGINSGSLDPPVPREKVGNQCQQQQQKRKKERKKKEKEINRSLPEATWGCSGGGKRAYIDQRREGNHHREHGSRNSARQTHSGKYHMNHQVPGIGARGKKREKKKKKKKTAKWKMEKKKKKTDENVK